MALAALLRDELKVVKAPDFLWSRVQRGIASPSPRLSRPVFRMTWAFAGLALLLLLIPAAVWKLRSGDTLNLGPYLEQVRNASGAASAPAIQGALPDFSSVAVAAAPAQLDGYAVSSRRVKRFKNAQVEQIVYNGSDSPVALFVAPRDLKISYGQERAHADSVMGIACRRVEGQSQRTLQFPCAAETCVLVCKACSENLLASLMRQVSAGLERARF